MRLTGLRQRLFRKSLYLRFLLFQRHRQNRTVLETIHGREFLILPGVFNPALFFSSEFFVDQITPERIAPDSKVLDLGTGSGVAAVFAALLRGQVTAVDLNPLAVRAARINAILNGVDERLQVLRGDLFGPVQDQRFDLVLFNPPYLPGRPARGIEQAFFSEDILDRYAAGLGNHLKPQGRSLVVLSSLAPEQAFQNEMQVQGFCSLPLARKKLGGETLTVYESFKP